MIGESGKPVLLKDSFIFISAGSRRNYYVFDRNGKFLNPIGTIGKGSGEYLLASDVFLNQDKPTIFIADFRSILEYEFNGNFVGSFQKPRLDGETLWDCSYVGGNLFVGQFYYDGKCKYKYALFDRNGNIIKGFPSHYFFNRDRESASTFERALKPARVDDRMYLMDYVNDTIYCLTNAALQPAYIFDFGKYSYPWEALSKNISPQGNLPYISMWSWFVGTPNFFFYSLIVPNIFSRPKARPIFFDRKEISTNVFVQGIYNISENTNILLNTDQYFQKGLINDINGGLSFIPQYYAGNGLVTGLWQAEDMKEILTEEYFSTIEIKDRQAHQKLREVLKKLDWEDNPAVVIAKLK